MLGAECPCCKGLEQSTLSIAFYHEKLIGISFPSQRCSLTVQMVPYKRRFPIEMVGEPLVESLLRARGSSHMENTVISAINPVTFWSGQPVTPRREWVLFLSEQLFEQLSNHLAFGWHSSSLAKIGHMLLFVGHFDIQSLADCPCYTCIHSGKGDPVARQ